MTIELIKSAASGGLLKSEFLSFVDTIRKKGFGVAAFGTLGDSDYSLKLIHWPNEMLSDMFQGSFSEVAKMAALFVLEELSKASKESYLSLDYFGLGLTTYKYDVIKGDDNEFVIIHAGKDSPFLVARLEGS